MRLVSTTSAPAAPATAEVQPPSRDPLGSAAASGPQALDPATRTGSTRLAWRVVHATRGRIRLRSPGFGTAIGPRAPELARLENRPGIRQVRLNPAAASLVIAFDADALDRDTVLAWLREARPELAAETPATAPSTPSQRRSEGPNLRRPLELAATVIGVLVMPLLPWALRRFITTALIAPTLAQGARSLLRHGVSMEMLDSLAVGLAAARGEFRTALGTHALLTLGEWLEYNTERHTDELLQQLLQPIPSEAWVERDGQLVAIPSGAIEPGDHVEVGTGAMIPIDGKVIGGTGSVNEASITGEPLSARKEAGDRVLSGTVVEDGRLRIWAMRVGEDTTTARIARFIEHSLQQQSRTQRRAAALADRRVYLTLGLGALVYLLTRNLDRLASVFLVDYACALKLGTPVTIKSAMYRGAQHGILFRGGQAIENLADAETFVFDKTGTLTTGLFEVTEVIVLEPDTWTRDDLLALAASLEEHVSHPLAEAVVDQARRERLDHRDHEEVDYLVAHGLTAHVADGQRVAIGSRHFLEEHEQVTFAGHDATIEALERAGETLLYIALGQRPLGIIGLRDGIRPETRTALARLRQARPTAELVLLTGDRQEKAEAFNRALAMDTVHAECSPEHKATIVQSLRKAGRFVAFLGDGVNDAPALTEADVGIAMPKSADLARATADVVLTDDDLRTLLQAEQLSRDAMGLIETHFHVSTLANTLVIAGAAFGRLSPVASALLHNGTTIGVLLNAIAGHRVTARPPLVQDDSTEPG
jgi:heavy metal translocating P-type ATPase